MSLKKYLGTLLLLTSGTAMAAQDGWHALFQLGYADSDYSRTKLGVNPLGGAFSARVGDKNDGLGGRLGFMYQFNEFIAMEAGYTRYADVQLTNIFGIPGFNGTLEPSAVDLTLRTMLPIRPQFKAFSKYGLAYASLNSKTSNNLGYNAKVNEDAIRPAYGLGVSYDLSENFSAELTWMRVQQQKGKIQNQTLTSLGVSYFLY